MNNCKIGAVVVTYNRMEKLKHALECFSNQQTKPLYLIVVDNASTDGTSELLKHWQKEKEQFEKIVITLETNTGGSGGFYRGLKESMLKNADWVWVSDDDAFPEPDVFSLMENYLSIHETDSISSVCASVVNHGKFDFIHRARYTVIGDHVDIEYANAEEYKKESFEINAFSYVGAVISINKMKKVGLTKKDFFIWCDDTEHSLRLSKVGKIICIPSAKVIHDQDISRDQGNYITWKNYYGIRNNCVMYRELFPGRCAKKYMWIRYKVIVKIALQAYVFGTNSREYLKMYCCAVSDGVHKRLGIHPIYKPGWSIQSKNQQHN